MNSTLRVFKEESGRSVALLERLMAFLGSGGEVGVRIDPALQEKIEVAIHEVSSAKLRVALVGGFSEGKTSIAAAWMEQLDRSSMNISHQESSNAVTTYRVGTEIELIDTPGLFGFKERENPTTLELEKYKDVTKKYVSEAHIVLYVMNPSNPVKESHQEELVWLLRTLGLLPRTVFVLSKFDEVADVEDASDYARNLEVKRANVIARLKDLVNLSEAEAASLAVVAVAANPFDMGIDHWLANRDQFKALSHIGTLQVATSNAVKRNGGQQVLVRDMQKAVISDVLHKELPAAIENDEKLAEEVEKLAAVNDSLQKQMAATDRDVAGVSRTLSNFVERYFTDLILRVQGCTMETIGEFYEREIGSEGIVLATRLQNRFSEEVESVALQVEKMETVFSAEVDHFNDTVTALGKQGVNHLLTGNQITNTTVLAARDGVVAVGKLVGLDLGKMLRFKPWGAVKFASATKGALAVAGLAMEAWDSWNKYQREEQFQVAKVKMVANFTEQRKDLLELLKAADFKSKFFPSYVKLEKNIRAVDEKLASTIAHQKKFHEWRSEAAAIDAEFRRLDH